MSRPLTELGAVEACLPLLQQTPPGQLSQVLKDIKGIVAASPRGAQVPEREWVHHAGPCLQQHAHDQLATVTLECNGRSEEAIVCGAGKLDGGDIRARYFYPRGRHMFTFDAATDSPSDAVPFTGHHASEGLRAAVDDALARYVYNHYHAGVSGAFLPERVGEEDVVGADVVVDDARGTVAGRQEPHISEGGEGGGEGTTSETTGQDEGAEDEAPEEGAPATKEMETKEAMDADSAGNERDGERDEGDAPQRDEGGASQRDGGDAAEPSSAADEATSQGTSPPPDAARAASADSARAPYAEPPAILTLHIVGNRYNLRNFWSGRWRSTYVVDLTSRAFVRSEIRIQAHYFENGNVQLSTHAESTLPALAAADADDDAFAEAVVAAVEKHEQKYQETLEGTTDMLRERAFKALRRTLPVTRQRIDWDKAIGYKLGSELQQSEVRT
ncbi:F-actin-capping protein subunit alpha [Malassezia sp. CBS 17886]|nr:F-actin-capping protein subunit alpha [Malassezia sp. CBS 17886]